MNAATLTPSTVGPRTIAIEGMKGDACVAKVSSALRGVAGVTTQSVKVGSAAILSDKSCCNHACTAIDHAGYKATENISSGATSNETADHSGNAKDGVSGDKSHNQKPDVSKPEMSNMGHNESQTNNRDGNTSVHNKAGANKSNGPIPTPTIVPGMNKPATAKQ